MFTDPRVQISQGTRPKSIQPYQFCTSKATCERNCSPQDCTATTAMTTKMKLKMNRKRESSFKTRSITHDKLHLVHLVNVVKRTGRMNNMTSSKHVMTVPMTRPQNKSLSALGPRPQKGKP